jgi:hypothetical protein
VEPEEATKKGPPTIVCSSSCKCRHQEHCTIRTDTQYRAPRTKTWRFHHVWVQSVSKETIYCFLTNWILTWKITVELGLLNNKNKIYL